MDIDIDIYIYIGLINGYLQFTKSLPEMAIEQVS